MGELIAIIIQKGSVIDLIIFLLGVSVVGYVVIQKNRLDKKEIQMVELLAKYNLLNNHVLVMSTVLSIATKRKLHKQEVGGEWSTVNPLIED